MHICKKCNYTHDTAINFCPLCGNEMQPFEQEPPVTPVYSAPIYPDYGAPATFPISFKVKKYIGMGLSIFGFSFSIIIAFLALVAAFASTTAESVGLFAVVLIYSLFALPPSIIGRCFSSSARNAGDYSSASGVGKALGLAGIIVNGVSLFIALLTVL